MFFFRSGNLSGVLYYKFMRLHRFYIGSIGSLIHGEQTKKITLDGGEYKQYELLIHQWRNVFKYTVGSRVVLFDDSGYEYECMIAEFMGSKIELAVILVKKMEESINKKEVWMFVSVLKNDNFDLVIQKCTELGIDHLVPVLCDRTIKKNINMARAHKIAVEATEQSGRTSVLQVYEPVQLKKAIDAFIEKGGELVVCHQKGDSWAQVSGVLKKHPLGFLVGPEGGWSDKEEQLFRDIALKKISFSHNVLRAETAAIGVATLVMVG